MGAREEEDEEEERAGDMESMVLGAWRVVLRWRWVVSALGGGGREMPADKGWVRDGLVGRSEARQRKHSPVP